MLERWTMQSTPIQGSNHGSEFHSLYVGGPRTLERVPAFTCMQYIERKARFTVWGSPFSYLVSFFSFPLGLPLTAFFFLLPFGLPLTALSLS
jgi:hypothetical protein